MMFKKYLVQLINGNDLSEKEMGWMMTEILSGNVSEAPIGAFMAALAAKGETYEELAAAARCMRNVARRIEVSAPVVADTCGTGGDGLNTFNISTTTAFVVAGCGITVAKHGNRSVSSACGSSDVLEKLGVCLNTDPEIVEEAVQAVGIGFLFAPLYHGAMKYAAKARKDVGIRSIFNMLGPLTNPAAASCQLLGVYAPELTEMFAKALLSLGVKGAFVVHGHDGLDEISVCAPTRVSELKEGEVKTYNIYPEIFFGAPADPDDLKGGTVSENAAITLEILKGEKGPRRNVVLINTAAVLVAANKASNLQSGIEMAKESIDQGHAMEKLNGLIDYTSGHSS